MDTATLIDLTTGVVLLIACLPVLAIALLFTLGFGPFILAATGHPGHKSGKRLMLAAATVTALATALYAGIYATTRPNSHIPTYELATWVPQQVSLSSPPFSSPPMLRLPCRPEGRLTASLSQLLPPNSQGRRTP